MDMVKSYSLAGRFVLSLVTWTCQPELCKTKQTRSTWTILAVFLRSRQVTAAKCRKDEQRPASFQVHFSFHQWFNILTITCSACCGHPRGSWSLKTRSCATSRWSPDVNKIDALNMGSSIAIGGTFYKWPSPGVPQKTNFLSCFFIFGSSSVFVFELRSIQSTRIPFMDLVQKVENTWRSDTCLYSPLVAVKVNGILRPCNDLEKIHFDHFEHPVCASTHNQPAFKLQLQSVFKQFLENK